MTREEAKEFAPILQAYAEGKTIQVKSQTYKWLDCHIPSFDEKPELYRVKPEPKYRPFNNAEECWQEMQKHQPFGWIKNESKMCNIINIEDGIITHNGVGNSWYRFKMSFDVFKFADGTPFGIKVEE